MKTKTIPYKPDDKDEFARHVDRARRLIQGGKSLEQVAVLTRLSPYVLGLLAVPENLLHERIVSAGKQERDAIWAAYRRQKGQIRKGDRNIKVPQ